MQRDFVEPGGFGASLGNGVGYLVIAVAGIVGRQTAPAVLTPPYRRV